MWTFHPASSTRRDLSDAATCGDLLGDLTSAVETRIIDCQLTGQLWQMARIGVRVAGKSTIANAFFCQRGGRTYRGSSLGVSQDFASQSGSAPHRTEHLCCTAIDPPRKPDMALNTRRAEHTPAPSASNRETRGFRAAAWRPSGARKRGRQATSALDSVSHCPGEFLPLMAEDRDHFGFQQRWTSQIEMSKHARRPSLWNRRSGGF